MATTVELANRVFDAFAAEDLAGDPRSTEMAAVLRELAAPDFVCSFIAGSEGLRNDFHGVEGLLDGWADWTGAFERYRIEREGKPIGTGDAVVGYTRQIATMRGSGSAIETASAGALFFRHERLTRLELHLDRGAALRSAGLGE